MGNGAVTCSTATCQRNVTEIVMSKYRRGERIADFETASRFCHQCANAFRGGLALGDLKWHGRQAYCKSCPSPTIDSHPKDEKCDGCGFCKEHCYV